MPQRNCPHGNSRCSEHVPCTPCSGADTPLRDGERVRRPMMLIDNASAAGLTEDRGVVAQLAELQRFRDERQQVFDEHFGVPAAQAKCDAAYEAMRDRLQRRPNRPT